MLTFAQILTIIWSYADTFSENVGNFCPYYIGADNSIRPSLEQFVGDNYYCQSGPNGSGFQPSDPLWDGEDCNNGEVPCCNDPQMPWFLRTLNESNDDIEVRFCGSQGASGEDTPIDILELYIK